MATLYDAIKPKSDQLNADDLKFKEKIIKITDVKIKDGEQPVSVFFEGDNGKPWKPCKTMITIMMNIWGHDEYGKTWIGHSVKLYRDPTVDFGANKGIGGVRFQEATGIKKEVKVIYTPSQARSAYWTVKPLGYVDTPVVEVDVEALKVSGGDAAQLGSDELKKWFTSLSKNEKLAIKPFMDDLKITAKSNDKEEEGVM